MVSNQLGELLQSDEEKYRGFVRGAILPATWIAL